MLSRKAMMAVSRSPASARGLRRIISTYSGPAIILRRSSDNTEQSFGFSGQGDLDTAAISTWLGEADGYITTLYDQCGGASMAQPVAEIQPKYVASAIDGKPAMYFNGTNNHLALPAASEILAGLMTMMLSVVFVPEDLVGLGALYNTDGFFGFSRNGSGAIFGGGGASYNTYNQGWFSGGATYIAEIAKSDTSITTIINGAIKRTDDTITPIGFPSAGRPSLLGARPLSDGFDRFHKGYIAEIVIYDRWLEPDALRATQGSYYGVTLP